MITRGYITVILIVYIIYYIILYYIILYYIILYIIIYHIIYIYQRVWSNGNLIWIHMDTVAWGYNGHAISGNRMVVCVDASANCQSSIHFGQCQSCFLSMATQPSFAILSLAIELVCGNHLQEPLIIGQTRFPRRFSHAQNN